MTNLETDLTIHAFTERGLGLVPFEFEVCIDNGGKRNLTTCDFCGAAIRYEYWVKSTDGHNHKVGSDCIGKSGDRGLINIAKRELAKQRAAAREAKRMRDAELRRAAYEADLQSQRDRNGGLTDVELSEQRNALKIQETANQNRWLLGPLKGQDRGYGFVHDMVYTLERNPIHSLTQRQLSVLAEIWAGWHGRRNSKAYKQAESTFWDAVALSKDEALA